MFEDKIEINKSEQQITFLGYLWRTLLTLALLLALVLTYLMFFPKSKITLPSFEDKTEQNLPLTGQDGLYFVELPSMKINLKPGESNYTYIEISIALELSKASDKKDISALLPRIQDAINIYLREVSSSELQESGSLYRMKEALLERINFLIAPAHINDVLFKELFVGQ